MGDVYVDGSGRMNDDAERFSLRETPDSFRKTRNRARLLRIAREVRRLAAESPVTSRRMTGGARG